MTQQQTTQQPSTYASPQFPYDQWMESTGLPIHTGHFVADARALELGWWEERQCNAAFLRLEGQQGVSEARITEIPPGKTLPPVKLSVGEIVYVLEGQGIASVWSGKGAKKTFEFQTHSLFHIPRHCWSQFSNVRGDRPAKLLNYNHLPIAMSAIPDPDFFFNNPYEEPDRLYGREEDYYSEAKVATEQGEGAWATGGRAQWRGNFFPDMLAWDKLVPFWGRGAGGHVVFIRFPDAEMGCHMSVFDPQLYKKAHKHGPGRIIVIPGGEGYSVLWPHGGEKVVCPWSEATIFVPPENWYHQHFNVGGGKARYLALAPLPQFSGGPYRHQIEYPEEDSWIRERFESELGKRGLKSLMPDIAYKDKDYEWSYGDDK